MPAITSDIACSLLAPPCALVFLLGCPVGSNNVTISVAVHYVILTYNYSLLFRLTKTEDITAAQSYIEKYIHV